MAKHIPPFVDAQNIASNLIDASFLNGVNLTVYDALGGGTTAAAVRTALGFPLAAGASYVGFENSGTGAVLTDLQARGRLTVQITDYGANTVPGTTQMAAALQLAINDVYLRGGGIVDGANQIYLVTTASGNTVTLPGSGATMPYVIELKPGVLLRNAKLLGDFVYRTTPMTTSQKIGIRLTDAPDGASYQLENVILSQYAIGVYGSGIISGYAKYVTFSSCALPFVFQKTERFEFYSIDMGGGAGICVGGWYDAAAVTDSSWCDKTTFRYIVYIRTLLGWTAYDNSVDTFFDVNFYNNASGANQVPYRGVVGMMIFIVGRYDRPNFNVHITDTFTFGAPRPAIYGGPEYTWFVSNINVERCGYTDYLLGSVMGVGTVDPWNPTRMKAIVNVYMNSTASNFLSFYAVQTAAIDALSAGLGNYLGMRAIPAANPDLLNSPDFNTMAPTALSRGIIGLTRSSFSTVPVGSVPYVTFGADVVSVAGTIYAAELVINSNFDLTIATILNGATVGSDKIILALYNYAGVLVAHTDLAGTLTVGANSPQTLPFTATYSAVGPGRYFFAYQCNGTTDTARKIAANTFIDVITSSTAGAFGTLPTIAPGSTFTANLGPIGWVA